jgi:phosphoribosylformylglycinamidine (FGAM) synthase-like enzyme
MEKEMKLAPLLLFALAGCSAATTSDTSMLTPLVTTTTNAPIESLPAENIEFTPEEFAFFDDVTYYNGTTPNISDEAVLEFGELWCSLLSTGMTGRDVVERINEGASVEGERELQFAIVLAGISNLCPENSSEIEYIALNSPLP